MLRTTSNYLEPNIAKITPILNPGNKLYFVPMHNVDEYPKVPILNKNDSHSFQGFYTGAISECVVIAAIDRDANSHIDKLAMLHYPGGINEKGFEHFIKGIDTFSAQKELIIFPGWRYDGNSYALSDHQALVNSVGNQFVRIHYQTAASFCVTFDDQIGTFVYDDLRCFESNSPLAYVIQQSDLHLTIKLFDELICHYQSTPNMAEKLTQLKVTILADSIDSDEVKCNLLEKTRRLIIKTGSCHLNDDKKKLYHAYEKDIKQMPLLSPTMKVICLVAIVTIIGIPVSLAIYGTMWHKRQTKLKTVPTILNLPVNHRPRVT